MGPVIEIIDDETGGVAVGDVEVEAEGSGVETDGEGVATVVGEGVGVEPVAVAIGVLEVVAELVVRIGDCGEGLALGDSDEDGGED